MIERKEIKGYWYLPHNEEATVAGILNYSPNNDIILEIFGNIDAGKDLFEVILDDNHYKVIFGHSSDGKLITLFNCYSSISFNFSSKFPLVKFNCQYLIIGKHLYDINDLIFNKSEVIFRELSHWCTPKALSNKISFSSEKQIEEIFLSFKANRNNVAIVNTTQIDSNTHLSLKYGISYNSSELFLKPQIEQYTYLQIEKATACSILTMLSDIYLFEQFLSLATLQSVKCSTITVYDPSLFQELENGEKIYSKIDIIYNQKDNTQNTKLNRTSYLFCYDQIKSKFSDIIYQWYNESKKIEPIRRHLINSIKKKREYDSIDFLIVIQAIEGFCIRFRNGKNLRGCIINLLTEFKVIDKINNDNINIDQVVESRHYYSHFMYASEKPNALTGIDLYDLTLKLKKLLICCLLSHIGFDNDNINSILNQSNSQLFIN